MIERFDAWMERCLYDPESGFYAGGGGAAGRRQGDFVTSPEVGPLFADVLARALDQWWTEAGRPDEFPVYDVGTGPGTLTRGLERAGGPGAGARRVTGLDRGDVLPDDLTGAVVIANELLDNLPFRILERAPDGWLEVRVDQGARARSSPGIGTAPAAHDPERPREVLVALPAYDETLVPTTCHDLPVGTRIPLLGAARDWVADILRRGPAVLLVFDYGTSTTAELARRGGWLRTYRRHERGHDPYHQPGLWDITTDVALDQLPPPSDAVDQATFLRRWGIEELVAEGRTHWTHHAARPDVKALRMRSRISEAEALLDPASLGSWLACTWRSRV